LILLIRRDLASLIGTIAPNAAGADVTAELVVELRCQTLPERDLDSAVMSQRWVGRKEEGS